MFAGLKLFAVEDENRVMAVLTYKDLALIEGLLAKVNYEHAVMLVQALVSTADVQETSGLTAVVQDAVERYREAIQAQHDDAEATPVAAGETRH